VKTTAILLAGLLALAVAAAAAASSQVRLRVASAPPNDVSSNWAGYVATGAGSTATTASSSMSYTDVTGQWVQPKATCDGAPSSVAVWVGLGGYSVSSRALEQAGTSADCHPDGTVSYYAWYELVPANSVTIKFRINPGDTVAAAVVVNGSKVLVQITDRTRGTRFTKRLTMSAPDLSSAEWIAEAPSECDANDDCQQVPLTDFDTVSFTRTFATGNDLGGTITSPNWTATAIQLVPHAHRVFGGRDPSANLAPAGAMPVGLAADGSGFTVEWQANSTSAG
jgi:hypothetical protein